MSLISTTTCFELFSKLRWITGQPLMEVIEPYRLRLFEQFLDEKDQDGCPRYNLGLFGRAKKNWKSADLDLATLAVLCEKTPGNKEVLIVAFDEDQARNNLDLIKRLIRCNPGLAKHLTVQHNVIAWKSGGGSIKVLPGQSVLGEHGRTYRFLAIDEVHTQENWDLLEALQPDPTRRDAQVWITSYASLYHKPGVPLFDLMQMGRAGTDPKMLFSWYAADYTTDPAFAEADPETRANPSRWTWADEAYLGQQQRRLPAHKYRRLHLNLPGLPEGSAFQVEPIANAIARGVSARRPEPGQRYKDFVDMSGGSNDDAVHCIGHVDKDGCAVIDLVENQGPPTPFDSLHAVARFAATMKAWGITHCKSDEYGGDTFKSAFLAHGIILEKIKITRSDLYAAFEPHLNSQRVVLLDLPQVEQQFLGLRWRGGKIDHPAGEHDDWSNAVAGCVQMLLGGIQCPHFGKKTQDGTRIFCDDQDCTGVHFYALGTGDAPAEDPEPILVEAEASQVPEEHTAVEAGSPAPTPAESEETRPGWRLGQRRTDWLPQRKTRVGADIKEQIDRTGYYWPGG